MLYQRHYSIFEAEDFCTGVQVAKSEVSTIRYTLIQGEVQPLWYCSMLYGYKSVNNSE
jgi:hypothetical protein